MPDQIKENPIEAALVRICAVWLTKSGRTSDSDELFWSQILNVKESSLHLKIKECLKMKTQLGFSKVTDQLMIDIYNELYYRDADSIKVIFDGARNGI